MQQHSTRYWARLIVALSALSAVAYGLLVYHVDKAFL